jgi:hypothetical protein
MNTEVRAIVAEFNSAFSEERRRWPQTSLRAGDALDGYRQPPPFDPDVDKPTDEYLERYAWGIGYLDAASFHHYLPRLVEYTLGHVSSGTTVGEFQISALRPPDREPPRLASFSPVQERALVRFLDLLAFTSGSAHQESAQTALEEWWAPGALYRGRRAV